MIEKVKKLILNPTEVVQQYEIQKLKSHQKKLDYIKTHLNEEKLTNEELVENNDNTNSNSDNKLNNENYKHLSSNHSDELLIEKQHVEESSILTNNFIVNYFYDWYNKEEEEKNLEIDFLENKIFRIGRLMTFG